MTYFRDDRYFDTYSQEFKQECFVHKGEHLGLLLKDNELFYVWSYELGGHIDYDIIDTTWHSVVVTALEQNCIEDLFEYLKIEHLPETSYSSVGGIIYELSETLPEKGTVVEVTAVDDVLNEKNEYVSMIADLTFTVEKVEDNRIQKVLLTVERKEMTEKEVKESRDNED